jgi:LPS export ABC transporter protein LptC
MRNRLIVLLIPLLLMLTAPLWWPLAADFLRPRIDIDDSAALRSEQKQFALENVYFTQSREGRPEWEITASQLSTVTERENELHLENVKAVLSDNDETRLIISSDQGAYDMNNLMLTLTNDVTVDMRNGHELRTDFIRYLERDKKVETEAQVHLDGPDLEIQGQGLVYDLASGSYSVGGPVTVVIK